VAEAQRTAAEGASGDDGPVDEILGKLGLIEDDGGEDLETAAKAVASAIAKAEAKGDKADGDEDDKPAKAEVTEEDEDAKRLREINARSTARRRVKEAAQAKRAGSQATQAAPVATPAQVAAKAALDAAEAAKAKPAAAAEPKNETVAAMRDILAQIEKLAGDDDEAAKKTAEGAADKGKDERAAALAGIREQVAKMADGLKETGELKEQLAKLTADLKAQADEATVKRVIGSAVDAIAEEVPLVSGGKRHEMQVTIDGAKQTVRWTGSEIIHWQAGRFYEKYGVAPDLKELARRIEKKLTADGSEKNGAEKNTGSRTKTVSTSHSSPPAARQSPDKRASKEAEADFFKRLGVEE
jgi:hypothetical protein